MKRILASYLFVLCSLVVVSCSDTPVIEEDVELSFVSPFNAKELPAIQEVILPDSIKGQISVSITYQQRNTDWLSVTLSQETTNHSSLAIQPITTDLEVGDYIARIQVNGAISGQISYTVTYRISPELTPPIVSKSDCDYILGQTFNATTRALEKLRMIHFDSDGSGNFSGAIEDYGVSGTYTCTGSIVEITDNYGAVTTAYIDKAMDRLDISLGGESRYFERSLSDCERLAGDTYRNESHALGNCSTSTSKCVSISFEHDGSLFFDVNGTENRGIYTCGEYGRIAIAQSDGLPIDNVTNFLVSGRDKLTSVFDDGDTVFLRRFNSGEAINDCDFVKNRHFTIEYPIIYNCGPPWGCPVVWSLSFLADGTFEHSITDGIFTGQFSCDAGTLQLFNSDGSVYEGTAQGLNVVQPLFRIEMPAQPETPGNYYPLR